MVSLAPLSIATNTNIDSIPGRIRLAQKLRYNSVGGPIKGIHFEISVKKLINLFHKTSATSNYSFKCVRAPLRGGEEIEGGVCGQRSTSWQ